MFIVRKKTVIERCFGAPCIVRVVTCCCYVAIQCEEVNHLVASQGNAATATRLEALLPAKMDSRFHDPLDRVSVGVYVSLVSVFLRIRYSTRSRLKFGERAFSIAAPRAWNSIPADLRATLNTATFKKYLKTFLFRESYSSF